MPEQQTPASDVPTEKIPLEERGHLSRTQLYIVAAILSLAVIGLIGYIMLDYLTTDNTTTQPTTTTTKTEETEEETSEVTEIREEETEEDSHQTVDDEQEIMPLLDSGKISGSLGFPSGMRPAMKVCAVNIVSNETICTEEYKANPCDEGGCTEDVIESSDEYSLTLAPGTYIVYSEITDSGSEFYKVRGYYSYYSYCISSQETKADPSLCLEEHTPTDGTHYDVVELTVEAGEIIEDIMPSDWEI